MSDGSIANEQFHDVSCSVCNIWKNDMLWGIIKIDHLSNKEASRRHCLLQQYPILLHVFLNGYQNIDNGVIERMAWAIFREG